MMIKFKFYYAKTIKKYKNDIDMMHKHTWAIYNHRVREHTIIQRDKPQYNHPDNLFDIDK